MGGLLRLRSVGYGAVRGLRNLALGLLIGTGAAAAQPVVIAALGDSLTAGYGLAEGEGFVPTMQAWLDDRGAEVELRNAGVSGDTTAGGLARVDWTLTDDVDGLIVALGANDMLRGIDPAVTRQNLAGILDAAGEAGVEALLFGIAAPGNYGPDYQRAFDAIYPELAEDYDALLGPTFLAPLRDAVGEGDPASVMQADGIHPNAAGVEIIVEGLGPSVLELAKRARR
ncbi:arylesterase [Psychromarinibacter sp. C21-152]|uniref:Arylesterase n=1 Tax=Psychromarinibacter sediminicola TaxID=3033385 RepID=A0AAE3NT82_9RHOB|nr:arylesterase [Psychromarinibacter sediminicola]MDF0601986.1 arylesterase [Psychromarinibacter sediminicola]